MTRLLDELARRNRFGMNPGLEAISAACSVVGNPERRLRGVVHVAGTNGKGAVCAMLDSCLRAGGFRAGRYTSPHLVKVNERFTLNGRAVPSSALDEIAARLAAENLQSVENLTYFEYLTLIAFILYEREKPDFTILETGLGGMFDATNVCRPKLTVITRIGLDHCAYLGDSPEKISVQKAGIIKTGVPVVLGTNDSSVCDVVRTCAEKVGAPFHYAPDEAGEMDIPDGFSLAGSFNRENARTAIAALKVLGVGDLIGLNSVVWPGRFQRIGRFIVDGAHNPPAAAALSKALSDDGFGDGSLELVCGFCADKDVGAVLRSLFRQVAHGHAVKTSNQRSLEADETARRMREAGIAAESHATLGEALAAAVKSGRTVLVCGSLFLAGEALQFLGEGTAGGIDFSESILRGG